PPGGLSTSRRGIAGVPAPGPARGLPPLAAAVHRPPPARLLVLTAHPAARDRRPGGELHARSARRPRRRPGPHLGPDTRPVPRRPPAAPHPGRVPPAHHADLP